MKLKILMLYMDTSAHEYVTQQTGSCPVSLTTIWFFHIKIVVGISTDSGFIEKCTQNLLTMPTKWLLEKQCILFVCIFKSTSVTSGLTFWTTF